MQIDKLHSLLARYTEIGFMEAVKAYQPSSDYISKTEVKQWLKMMHIEEKKFKQMIVLGLISIKRKGTAKNSPLYYSKKDIISALGTVEVNNIVCNYIVNKSRYVNKNGS